MEKRLYVITRDDLDLAYAAVQAGHGLAAWMLDNPHGEWKNETLVYCVEANELRLAMLAKKLVSKGYEFSSFHEPVLDGQLTAIACLTNSNVFDNLKLLGAG